MSKKRATFKIETERIKVILDQGNGEIGDIINSKQDEAEASNKEVKLFLMEQLQDSIKFCSSKSKNESLPVFPSKLSAEDIVQKVRSTVIIKSAAFSLHHAILEESYFR